MFAVINIGSNSVRLMLWANGNSFYKRIATTRLGEGLASGELSERAMSRTAEAVALFAEEARARSARIFLFATAAVRKARNGSVFCKLVEARTGLAVDVVSGEEEALLALFGALKEADGGIIDIGGGSTEICFRKAGKVYFSVSLDIGAVRLYDACRDDPALLERKIGLSLEKLETPRPVGKIYAVGGTASTLASLKLGLKEYDGKRIQDLPLSYADVTALAEKLLSLSAEERGKLAGMDKPRADIIAGGALLLRNLMEKLSLSEVFASDRDNLEGYLALRRII